MIGHTFRTSIGTGSMLVLLCVSGALLAATALGADDLWQELNAKGKRAYEHGRLGEAEEWFLKALEEAQSLETEKARLVTSLNNLAALYASEGRYDEAELHYQRSLALLEELQGPKHPDLLLGLNNLISLYLAQEQYGKAEPLARRSLGILEQALGSQHPHLAPLLNTLGELTHIRGNYADAEVFYKRALAIEEESLGPDHPELADTLKQYAKLLRATGRHEEAASVEARVEKIQASNNEEEAVSKGDPLENMNP